MNCWMKTRWKMITGVLSMSNYTTELRFICEMKSGFTMEEIKEKTPEEIITAARPNIFNFDYPIYAAELKEPLELKILRHYYTREIGQETFGLWQWRLQSRMIEIMPKYNKLYEAEYKALSESGLNNVDIEIIHNYTPGVKRSSKTTTAASSEDAYSDTPQGGINEVKELDYLTDFRATKNNGSVTNEDLSVIGTDTDVTHEAGYRGGKTFFEIMNDYRDKIFNIDQLIIMELNDLFFLLY